LEYAGKRKIVSSRQGPSWFLPFSYSPTKIAEQAHREGRRGAALFDPSSVAAAPHAGRWVASRQEVGQAKEEVVGEFTEPVSGTTDGFLDLLVSDIYYACQFY
jgi:hypothetical protein